GPAWGESTLWCLVCSRLSRPLVSPGNVSESAQPYFPPRGRSQDSHHSLVFCTFACWIAPAGSTFLGQTLVHSPTKVHSQMPSLLATTSALSSLAPSRESRL